MRYLKSFFLLFFMLSCLISLSFGDDFAKLNGLPVDNDTIYPMDRRYFEMSYVEFNYGANAFDRLLYDEFGGSIGANGVCFGMSVLAGAIYTRYGFMGMCRPVGTLPHDTFSVIWPHMRDAIYSLQIRQLSYRIFKIVVDLLSEGTISDGNYAYDQIETYIAQGKIPVICITKTTALSFSTPGHAMLAYKVEDLGSERRIYVYDPTRPYFKFNAFYDFDSNYIHIDALTGHWTWRWPDNSIWDGLIYAIPGDLVLMPIVNPLYLENLTDLSGVILASGAHITQIEDSEGRRLFKHPVSGVPNLSDLEDDPDKKIGNIAPWIPLGGSAPPKTEMYIVYGVKKSYKVRIAPESNYRLMAAMGGKMVELKSKGASTGADIVELRYLGTNMQHVKVKPSRPNATFDVKMVQSSADMKKFRIFEVDGINLSRDNMASIGFSNGGKAIKIVADKMITCDLKLESIVNGKSTRVSRKSVVFQPGQKMVIKPSSWMNLKGGKIKIMK